MSVGDSSSKSSSSQINPIRPASNMSVEDSSSKSSSSSSSKSSKSSSSSSSPTSTTVRLVFLGAAGVGKSALILRFLHDRYLHKYTPTVEELHALEYDTQGGGKVRLEILDTSGLYSFPAMRRLCIRHSDAFALVYAVDDPASLEEVRRLRDEILEVRRSHGEAAAPPITVVGSKADLKEAEGRVLLAADVMATVEKEWDASFVEASARTGGNAVGVFRALLQHVNLPPQLSPALQRRRGTDPAAGSHPKKRPPLKKNNSCVLS